MPSGTSIKQFIKDLKEGKSTVARAFDDLFGTNTAINEWQNTKGILGQHWPELTSTSFSQTNLPDWAVWELKNEGPGSQLVNDNLTDADIQHINGWSPGDKEKIRAAVVSAISAGHFVQFFWELWDGAQSEIKIHAPQAGATIITFRTPRSNLMLQGTQAIDIAVKP